MTPSITPIDVIALTATLRESVASGANREDLIHTMRTSGLNQIACIKLLRDLCGISLGDAKEAVHYSRTWADHRESNDALHDAAAQAARDLGFVEVAR